MAAAGVAFHAFAFTVRPDERGVVLRFGEFVREQSPGLHFRMPYPIEEVRLPRTTFVNRTEIGVRRMQEVGRAASAQDPLEETLILTGDENIIDIGFVVLWIIDDAPAYLFNIQRPDVSVKEVAESAMREIIGRSRVQDALTDKRAEIEQEVRELLQRTLDSYKSGIRITQLQMQQAEAPAQVIDAFRDVAAAAIDQQRIQNEAQVYANTVIPEARGAVQRILQEARGYRERVIAEAHGEADRFLSIMTEYQKAPGVTRKRLRLETMERVLGNTDKVIIDGKAGRNVVPYLLLGPPHP